jgi:hypothetical protein
VTRYLVVLMIEVYDEKIKIENQLENFDIFVQRAADWKYSHLTTFFFVFDYS